MARRGFEAAPPRWGAVPHLPSDCCDPCDAGPMDALARTGHHHQYDHEAPRDHHVAESSGFPWTGGINTVKMGDSANLAEGAVEGASAARDSEPATGAAIHYGARCIINQRKSMEDFYYAKEKFIQLPLSVADTEEIFPAFVGQQGRVDQRVALAQSVGSWTAAARLLRPSCPTGICVLDDFHLFAVFDGHGGPDVSRHCSLYMHRHLHAALTSRLHQTHQALFRHCLGARDTELRQSMDAAPVRREDMRVNSTENELTRTFDASKDPLESVSTDADTEMAEAAEQTQPRPQSAGVGMTARDLKASMIWAFEDIDKEVQLGGNSSFQGSTAVAALVGTWHICVASCGECCLRVGAMKLKTSLHHAPQLDSKNATIWLCR